MAGPEGGEGHGGGVAAEEAAGGGATRGGARSAAAGGSREGTSSLSSARGTSWSPSSRTFPVAAGRGRGVVAATKGGIAVVADEHNNGNNNTAASVTTAFKQTVQTVSTGSAPAAGGVVDGGPMRGKRAAGSPSLRKAAPGSEDDTLISSRVTAAAQQLEWAAAASSPDPAADAAAPGAPQQPPAGAAPSRTQEPPGPTQEDFALEVNGCFQKMYSGVYSVDLVVSLLQRLAQAPLGGRDSSLFLAMLRTLFFECRHFPRYPTQELLLTAELFGKLIASQVLLHQPGTTSSSATANPSSLVIALRCVLEALRKGPNSKMFLFGVAALEQVLPRLYLFPEFLVSLSCLPPHFNLQCPHYTAYIENLLLLIPKPLHACVCLDPAAAATALPPIPEPPATRGPGATNLTPVIVAPPAGIVSAVGTSQQQQQQQGLASHAPTPTTPTAATTSASCLQANKAPSPAAPGVKPGEGGGERGGAGGGGLEQRRRQQLQAAGLLQQQQHGVLKGMRSGGGGAAGPSDIGLGAPTVLGSEAAANAGEPGAAMLLGGTGPRPYFAAGAAALGVPAAAAAGEQSGGCAGGGQQQLQQEPGTLSSGSGGATAAAATVALLQQQQHVAGGGDPNNLILAGGGLTTPPAAIGALLQGVGLGQVEGLMNDRELLAKLVLPPQWLAEQVIAACNSICEANVEEKAAALRHVLAPEHQAWFAFYLVKSRASKEPNLHAIFYLFIEKLEMSGLPDVVINMSYDCINTLFKYLVEAKESSSYRTLLKNLGLWLGRITLARNRPLMCKRLDLKALLFRGYDEGHLVAVLPLVCKVLEGVKLSKVFQPPNPWTNAMLSLLAELQQLSNLRTNLIFEVEVLFKHLHINVQDYHGRSHHLARRPVPSSSTDFVIRTPVGPLDITACPPAAAAASIKPLAAALSLPGAAAAAGASSALLAAGPPPGIVVPAAAALGSAAIAAAAAQQQQQATAAAPSPPATTSGSLRPAAVAAAAAHARPGAAAASSRSPAVTTSERGVGSAVAAVDGGVGAGAVCSRLLLAAAAGNAAAAQKLQQQQQQRGPAAAAGAQLLETHQAGGSRLGIDAVTAGLRTAAAAGAAHGTAGPLQQQQLLSQQQQLLLQRQQFPQLQAQAGGAPVEAAASDGAAGLRGSGPRVTAEETLLQHHQRLLAAASAAGASGSAGDGVPGTAEDAEALAAAGRRDPRSLLLAAAMRGGAAAGEASSLFLATSSTAAAAAYAQQQTAADRSPFLSSASYGGEPQGSPPPPPWPSSLTQEQQGAAEAATTVGAAGASASLLSLLQQQAAGGGGGATLLEQQQQVGAAAAAGSPPPPPTQKSSPAAAAQLHQAAAAAGIQGSPYRTAAAAAGVVAAAGGAGSGLIEGAAAAGGNAPSLFGGSSAAAEAFAAGVGSSTLMPSDTLLQSLAQNVVISPSIALLSLQPALRPLVPLAVERAVREIISAVAERSVTISCVTTRELVCKDFCMEGEESLIKRAAHLMVASLAGSLALITCREPLRVSLTQNLRQLLQPVASTPECGDQVLVEQVLQIVSTDNLDLGCSVIEQAVVEKVLRDIEISIQPALLQRRQAKERGVPFVDTQYVNSGRWPAALPEPLKLHPLLNTRQLQVYKDFMLIGPLRKMHQQHLYGTQQLQQRSGGGQQQVVGGGHGLGGVGVAGAGGAAGAAAGGSAAARDSGEGAAALGLFGAGGASLPLSGAAAAARLPGVASQQQQQREALQQMAATVAAARVLNQQQQKLLQLQQQGIPSSTGQAAESVDSSRQQALGAVMLGAAAAGASPQQQRGTPPSTYAVAGAAAAAALQQQQQQQSQLSHYSGQEQTLSALMLRLEGCLVQLRDVVRDIFNSPPVMPTPTTAHRFSHPAGCQMHALPVPMCSTSALLVFACLPSNHELFQLIASVSSVASTCTLMDEVAPALAHKLIKSVFEGAALAAHRGSVGTALRGVDPTGLYMEVFFAVLAALRRESEVVGKLAGEVLSISCASATLPPKRSNVAVAAGLMRYGLIDFSAFDGVLANHLEGGRNAPVVEFVLVLLKVLQDQHAVSPAALPSTFKTLAAADALPQRSVQLRGWESLSLTEARDKLLEAFQEREALEKKKEEGARYTTTLTQLMEDYCMPAYPVKVRCLPVLPEVSADDQALVRQIFEDWIRLSTAPGSVSSSSSSGAAAAGGSGFGWMTHGMPQQLPAAQAANLFAHRRSVEGSEPAPAAGAAAAAVGGGGQQQQQWGEENGLLLRAMFFQKISQQGLLRMDEDTDRFFAVCVEAAIEKATVMLRSQQASAKNSSSTRKKQQQQTHETSGFQAAEEAATSSVAATDSKGDTARASSTSTAAEGKDRRSTQQQQQKEQTQNQSRAEDEEDTASAAAENAAAAGEGNSSSSEEQQDTDSTSSRRRRRVSSSGAGASQKSAGVWAAAAAGDKRGDLEGDAAADRDLKREDKEQQQEEASQQQEAGKLEEAEDAEEKQQQQQQQSPCVLAVDPTTSAEAFAAMETPPEETEAPLEPLSLDAFAKMISAMMRFVDPQQVSPVLILQRALGVVCRHMHMVAESLGSEFNQRPYFRLLLSILLEVTSAAAFPLLAAAGGAAASSGSVAGATAGGSQQSGSSEAENALAAAAVGMSSPGGGGEGPGADATAVAAQQLLLQQSILSFADHLALLCPLRLPAFAFAWLELVGHRTFLPLLLRGPGGMRGGSPRSGWVALHKLLLLHFEFIHPFLASVSLSDSVRQLYKGTLRVLLVLLHDFPEYLCETYVDCCSVLPLNCVQLRNVILSAFPRNMRLPDPFLPNLRIDLLPEVKLVPRLLLTHSFYSVLLLHHRQQQQLLKSDVDLYWHTRDVTVLPRIRKKLLLASKAEALKRGTKYDVPLFNAFLLYVATSVPEHDPRSTTTSVSSAVLPPGPLPPTGDSSSSSGPLAAAAAAAVGGERAGAAAAAGSGHQPPTSTAADPNSNSSNNPYGCQSSSPYALYRENDNNNSSSLEGGGNGTVLSPALEIILYLAKELDMEGRYLLMSAIANHLRFPNAHTYFFSSLLLWLFSESKEELVQEQITRVLLERLIVHRPHPWGLLITFIELIKNPKFAFWSCLFVSAAPEVEKLFQSVAHTCLGQSGAQQLQQQRQR